MIIMTTPMMNNIENLLQKFESDLSKHFERLFCDSPKELKDASSYALFSGGKRIRPILCFLSADFLDLSYEKVLPLAISIEMIHSYSLIHDDLPCMDNDDFRRGKPTVHKKFGEAIALLSGDALLNGAFENLFNSVVKNPELTQSAYFIARCAGNSGMIGGQAKEFITFNPSYDDYMDISLNKTGKLICASILSPAFLSFDKDKFNALSSFGKAVGLGFQVADDLLDKDKEETMSLVTICGEEKSRSLLDKTFDIAEKSLRNFQDKGQQLLEFSKFLTKRTY